MEILARKYCSEYNHLAVTNIIANHNNTVKTR